MYCKKCGTELFENAVFCPKCRTENIERNDFTEQTAVFDAFGSETLGDSIIKKKYWTPKRVIIGIVIGIGISLALLIIGNIIFYLSGGFMLKGVYGGNAKGGMFDKHYPDGNYNIEYDKAEVVHYDYFVEFSKDGSAIWWQDGRYYTGSYTYKGDNTYILTKQGSGMVITTTFFIKKNNSRLTNFRTDYGKYTYIDKNNDEVTKNILHGSEYHGPCLEISGGGFNSERFEYLENINNINDAFNEQHINGFLKNPTGHTGGIYYDN